MIKFIFDNLEKRNSKGHIDWEKSIGKTIKFESLHKNGEILILDTCRYKTNTKILIEYNKNKKWIFTSELKPKNYCDFLNICDDTSTMNRVKEFKYKIGERVFSDKYDFTVLDKFIETKEIERKNLDGTNRVKNDYKYLLRCNHCGYDKLIRKERSVCCLCPVCCNSPQIVVKGINDITTTNPELIKFFPNGESEASKYNKSSNKKIDPRCPNCGKISKKLYTINYIWQNNKIPCDCNPTGMSYWEKFVNDLLKQLSFYDCYGKRFEWCYFYNHYKNKYTFGIYDFCIENLKIIIETDGTFHREDNLMSGQTVEESVYLDMIKDELAIKNGYKIIRLPLEKDGCNKNSWKIIKDKIMRSEIPILLNFKEEDIDWKHCDLYAASSLLIDACNIYEQGEKDLRKIAKTIGMSKSTVLNYLHKGTEMGLCNYNPNLNKKRNGNRKHKQITVFDSYMNKIGVFKSKEELETKSKDIFGIKFLYSGITKACCTGAMYKKHYFKAEYV